MKISIASYAVYAGIVNKFVTHTLSFMCPKSVSFTEIMFAICHESCIGLSSLDYGAKKYCAQINHHQ